MRRMKKRMRRKKEMTSKLEIIQTSVTKTQKIIIEIDEEDEEKNAESALDSNEETEDTTNSSRRTDIDHRRHTSFSDSNSDENCPPLPRSPTLKEKFKRGYYLNDTDDNSSPKMPSKTSPSGSSVPSSVDSFINSSPAAKKPRRSVRPPARYPQ
ncbi:hypothetical protein L5515_003371 [Caenorhabditis briggsae]|uniref:Uncharacterized protein n=1 Tax=Caenorhabditis briggsae TaxID=6238 RepID=A0AAE9EKE7_CAEBR|nr:hypothetical protein L5515_003371 [Caenorhabditis briggsae]